MRYNLNPSSLPWVSGFVPEQTAVVDLKLVLRNEPNSRGAGKPQMVEELFWLVGNPFLPFWQRVLMNTETQRQTMRFVAFLD